MNYREARIQVGLALEPKPSDRGGSEQPGHSPRDFDDDAALTFAADIPSEPPTLKWLPDTTRGRRT